jgi:hypothetical protein
MAAEPPDSHLQFREMSSLPIYLRRKMKLPESYIQQM